MAEYEVWYPGRVHARVPSPGTSSCTRAGWSVRLRCTVRCSRRPSRQGGPAPDRPRLAYGSSSPLRLYDSPRLRLGSSITRSRQSTKGNPLYSREVHIRRVEETSPRRVSIRSRSTGYRVRGPGGPEDEVPRPSSASGLGLAWY